MKRLIVATAVALSAPALAEVGKPFEQTELDRALPQIAVSVAGYEGISADRMPFEQSELDRRVTGEQPERVQLAQLGSASYKSATDDTSAEDAQNPWANDHNFIAPAP